MDKEQSLEIRVTRMEERMDRQREDINAVRDRQTEQHHDMKAIANRLDILNDTISRGQWIIIGAVGFFMMQSMGLAEFLRKLLL